MDQQTKRFILNLVLAYAALVVVMALVWLGMIPAGPISLIALDLALIWVNVASCKWLPNTLPVLIPAFCLILAYQGFCYHSKQN